MKKISTLALILVLITSFHSFAQQNVGIGTTNPLQKLHIGGSANTIRIDGIATGGTFLIAPSATTNLLLYTNSIGDVYSMPLGANGSVLSVNGSGVIGWTSGAGLNYWTRSGTNLYNTNQADNVGIGTSSPISTLQAAGILTVGSAANAYNVGNVQITNNGSSPIANRLTFGTDGSGWKFSISKNQGPSPGTISDLMTFQDNGNVGIGTTSPGSFLDITNSTLPTMQLTNTNTSNHGALRFAEFQDAGGFYMTSNYKSTALGGWSVTGGTLDDAGRDGLQFSGQCGANGNATTNFFDFAIGTSGTLTDLLRIQANGGIAMGTYAGVSNAAANGFIVPASIGIGTPSPASLLDITNSSLPTLQLTNTNTSNHGALRFAEFTDAGGFYMTSNYKSTATGGFGITGGTLDDGGRDGLQFSGQCGANGNATTNFFDFSIGTSGTLNDLMRIQANGNVGIGTASPNSLLDVTGASAATANMQITSFGTSNHGALRLREFDDAGGFYITNNLNSPATGGPAFTGGSQDFTSRYSLQFSGQSGVAATTSYFDFAISPSSSTTLTDILRIEADSKVGIGTASPASMLSVGSTSQFQVNSSGNIVKVNNVAYSFPSTQGAATTFLQNDGAGNLTWAAGNGGSSGWTEVGSNLYDTHQADNVGVGTTAPASIFHAAGQISSGIPLGGLGGALAANGSILFYNPANANTVTIQSGATSPSGYTLTLPAAVASGPNQALLSDGSGNLSWGASLSSGTVSGTVGQVGFYTGTNALGGSSNLFWNSGSSSLGIGTATPASALSIGSTSQFQVNSSGNLVMVNNVPYSFPSSQGAASTVLQNDGTGNLTWAAAGGASGWTEVGSNLYDTHQTDDVGIGTTTPASFLDITNSTLPTFQLTNTNTSNHGALRFAEFQDAGGFYITSNLKSTALGGPSFSGGTLDHTGRDALQFSGQCGTNGNGTTNYFDFAIGTSGTLTDLMRIQANGDVGIGTASPSSMLSVGATSQFQVNSSGNIVKVNNVTYSFPSSQGSAATYLQNDGSGNLTWAAGGGGGGTITGSCSSGANYLPKMDATTDITCSQVYDNGTNVGIGTASPGSHLDVTGATAASANIQMTSLATSNHGALRLREFDDAGGFYISSNYNNPATGGFGITGGTLDHTGRDGLQFSGQCGSNGNGTTNFFDFSIGTSGTLTDLVRIQANGNVGIGTAGPLSKLDINGGVAIGTYAGTTAAPSNGLVVSGSEGVGTASPNSALEVNGAVGTTLATNSSGSGAVALDNTAAVWYFNGTFTGSVTLPAAAAGNKYRRYIIVNVTASPLTVSGYTDLTGAANTSLANNSSIEVISNGTNWLQIK